MILFHLLRIDYLRFSCNHPIRLGTQRTGQLTFRSVLAQELLGSEAADHHLESGSVVRQRSLGPEEPERQVPGFERRLHLHPTQMEGQVVQVLLAHGFAQSGQGDGPAGVTIRGLDEEPLRAVLHIRKPFPEAAVEDHVAGPVEWWCGGCSRGSTIRSSSQDCRVPETKMSRKEKRNKTIHPEGIERCKLFLPRLLVARHEQFAEHLHPLAVLGAGHAGVQRLNGPVELVLTGRPAGGQEEGEDRLDFAPAAASKEPLTEPQVEAVEGPGDLGDVSEEDGAVRHSIQHRLDVQETTVGLDVKHVERRCRFACEMAAKGRLFLQPAQNVLLDVSDYRTPADLLNEIKMITTPFKIR